MRERRRRKGFNPSEMNEGVGTSLSNTLQDKVEQEIKEADHFKESRGASKGEMVERRGIKSKHNGNARKKARGRRTREIGRVDPKNGIRQWRRSPQQPWYIQTNQTTYICRRKELHNTHKMDKGNRVILGSKSCRARAMGDGVIKFSRWTGAILAYV